MAPTLGRLTPQERIRLAKKLFDRANYQRDLKQSERKEARRCAYNLIACNMIEAKKRLGLYVPVPRPASLRRSN